jgi:hypothetical protein
MSRRCDGDDRLVVPRDASVLDGGADFAVCRGEDLRGLALEPVSAPRQ